MSTALAFDPADAGFQADRYPTYRRLRDEAPALKTELNGRPCRIVTRYADVDAVLRDERARVQPSPGEVPAHVGTGPASDFYRYSLPCIDAPDHTRLRRLMTPAFTPRTVAKMRGWIEEIVQRRLDELTGAGEIEFVHDFAAVVPAQIACRLIHAPEADAKELLSRQPALNAVLSQGDVSAEALAAADAAAQYYFDYFGEIIDALRGKLPDDDVVGAMLAAEEDGDRLSRIELVTALIGLLIASYHTTMVSFTSAVHSLLTHPDQLALLRADAQTAAGAWEESLRYDAPIHFIWRDLVAPMEIAGDRVEAGEHLVLGLAAANRDERRFPDPDRFDIRRDDRRHMAFAAGSHYCLGTPLSRLEGAVFLPRFFARFPGVALTGEPLTRYPDLTFTFIERLPLRLGPAA